MAYCCRDVKAGAREVLITGEGCIKAPVVRITSTEFNVSE